MSDSSTHFKFQFQVEGFTAGKRERKYEGPDLQRMVSRGIFQSGFKYRELGSVDQ